MPYTCITRLVREGKKQFFQLSNRKNLKANIMLFRTLCSIEIQGLLFQKHEFTTV
jgi:hypothetical protein